MKKASFFLLLLFCGAASFAQSYYTIYGKVISAETRQPLQAASVFAENTTLGTVTDAEGNFRLALPDGGYNLIITFTGHNTVIERISQKNANQHDVVYELSQQQKQMEEVAIVATSEVTDGWNKYGDFFIEKFIGKTKNSQQSTILNKDAVKFYFSKKRNRLKVLATEPLQIENKALGYNIKYSLDSFTHEYNTEVSLYTGYPLFEEMTAENYEQERKWMQARQEVYKGSMLHFMRSLYNKTLKEQGFEVQFIVDINEKETALPVKDFYAALNYVKDDSTQLVEIKPNQLRVGVIYNKEKPAATYTELFPDEPSEFQFSMLGFLPSESIGIEQNGYYFNQNDVAISAYWTWDRMADQLPYNYALTLE
ncbi:MAG: carboxypeptidase-like regulatory domain-containing protein [Chitinophagaceae bacterium]|nr:MAG: carboxypeptidase-like regulatory domain-containing protein [Chitinophagaceae bacterium]